MSDIVTRLRQTRADMIGTDDEQHYFDCQDAADRIKMLEAENKMLLRNNEFSHRVIKGFAAETERLRIVLENREALGVAIQCVEAAMAQRQPEEEESRDLLLKTANSLRRILDRTEPEAVLTAIQEAHTNSVKKK